MAKRFLESRKFTVSVVGLSGTEKEKGATGIGKSCLCNRFTRPLADDYYNEHITVLSQSDFGGRVVNNDHFLYWGDVTKTSDEGQDLTFHVVEQTEFIDDSSFQAIRIGKTEPYYKRCANVKVQSAEKLMYICKNQLGLEHEFEQRLLPEGRLSVDGFLCAFDVSLVPDRQLHMLVEHTTLVLQSLLRTKKPIVLVTTKQDEVNDFIYKEAEKIVQRFKGIIPLVETSAHKNINVEAAFLTLAQLIDRTKNRPKIVPYTEAAHARKEVLDVATEAYLSLVRAHVSDYKALWIPIHRRLQNNSDYTHYVEIFGTDEARKLFRRHVLQLREELVRHKQEQFLRELEVTLRQILPDLTSVADRSWPSILRWMKNQDFFDRFFVIPADADSDFLESTDKRIPYTLLLSNEAENRYRDHVNSLRAAQRKAELRKQFEQLLADNHQVCAGKSLSEVAIFFLGRECFSALSEHDKQSIYESHQRELRDRAKRQFLELLLESADWLSTYRHGHVTQEDLRDVDNKLQHEARYRALARLEEDRKVILLNHLGFMQCPSQDKCPFKDQCMEVAIHRMLTSKAHRPQSWSHNSDFLLEHTDKHLNLVLLGSDGLADQLAKEIREQCTEDEYSLDGCVYNLDYRTIDGDVCLPQNSLKTADFLPHGCFCVFNSPCSLDYIKCSLEKTLLSSSFDQRLERLPFQGLPIVIVLAHDPDITEKGLMHLRDQGQDLADRLQCPFIDIPSSMMTDSSKRFHSDQIGLAMHNLVKSIQHRSSLVNPTDWQTAESLEPDIRVLMCFMCGDSYSLDLPLAPLLNHQCCYVNSDQQPSITLETYLDESKRKVCIVLASYHAAQGLVMQGPFHGFILVYSAKRQASLATLSAFLNQLPSVPTKLLAVTETGAANAFFSNDHTQHLLVEGNKIADDRLTVSFMVTCANFQQQTASYTPFFRECWDRKADTQLSFNALCPRVDPPKFSTFKPHQNSERYKARPPATLPRQSALPLDPEPLYDVPHTMGVLRLSEESDDERVSSMSPSPHGIIEEEEEEEELYSCIPDTGDSYEDTDQLIQPTSKRSLYAGLNARSTLDDVRKRLLKSSSLPFSSKLPDLPSLPSAHGGYEEIYQDGPAQLTTFKSKPKPKVPTLSKPLNLKNDVSLRHRFDRSMTVSGPLVPSTVKAPLATPEPVEIPGDYAQVKKEDEEAEVQDVIRVAPPVKSEYAEYASVADALPKGRVHKVRVKQHKEPRHSGSSDSDSEHSSELGSKDSSGDLYSRVQRRPTPHKTRRSKHSASRLSDGCGAIPPLPVYSLDRQMLLQKEQLYRVKACSASEGSEGTGDEVSGRTPIKKRSLKKKKEAEAIFSDSDLVPIVGGDDMTFDSISSRIGEEGEEVDAGVRRRWLKFGGDGTDKKRRAKDDKRQKKEEERKKDRKSKKKKEGGRCIGGSSGCTLEDYAAKENSLVPAFVEKCVALIEEEGLTTEGLYRVPGNRTHVDQLMELHQEDPRLDYHSLDIPVNAFATALKQFFSDLAEPVVPEYLYAELTTVSSIQDKAERLSQYRDVLAKLPPANREVLRFIITHIQKVSEHTSENCMDSKNLAICWWPTLLRPEITSLDTVHLISKPLEEFTQTLIDHCQFFFHNRDHQV